MKRLLFVLLALVMVIPFTCLAGAEDNEVNVYANPLQEWIVVAMQEFTKDTGIKVNWVYMGSGETFARVKAEAANPKADVWWGGTLDPHIQAKDEGLLDKYVSPNDAKIPKEFKDPEGYWRGMYVGVVGFTVNTGLLKKLKLPVPHTWKDLIKPQYKKLISMSNPETSGTAFTIMATLIQIMGEDKAYDYLKKLHKNIFEYTKSGTGPIGLVGLGEAAIGINFVHDTINFAKKGQPVSPIVPSDKTGYEIGGLSILKGAPHLKNAQKLVDWTLTAKAQALAAPTGSYQLPTNPDAAVPPEAVPLSKIKVVQYDFKWTAANRDRLIKRWTTEVGIIPR